MKVVHQIFLSIPHQHPFHPTAGRSFNYHVKQEGRENTDRVTRTGTHEDLLHDKIHDFFALTLESIWSRLREFCQDCDMSKKFLVIYVLEILGDGLYNEPISKLNTNGAERIH